MPQRCLIALSTAAAAATILLELRPVIIVPSRSSRATTNPSAEAVLAKLPQLRGCKAHCTAILSDKDETTLKALGIDVTSDPEYITNNLYYG